MTVQRAGTGREGVPERFAAVAVVATSAKALVIPRVLSSLESPWGAETSHHCNRLDRSTNWELSEISWHRCASLYAHTLYIVSLVSRFTVCEQFP